ncbi:MAG: phosphoribosyltransferase [Chitinophagaceae bacterium]|nr:phosphoribosyltransferase [Chitinophagaceae bacterium]
MLRRMALQIIENNLGEQQLVIAGIKDRGVDIALLLIQELKKLSKQKFQFTQITINKLNPLEVAIDENIDYKGQVLIVVDDVADSGKTMLYALKPFLQFNLKKLEIAVLIDRDHKLFPVTSTYVGYEISTTVKEKIRVEVEKDKIIAYLC